MNFDEVLEAASNHIKSLPDATQRSLKEDLENGLANLSSRNQLQMYLSAYGNIHRQKLMMAYEKIPTKVWSEGKLAVIDYGCGQCVAEMVLADFMKSHYIDNDIIGEFIIIEPSRASIKQGIKCLQAFFNDCDITSFNDTAGKITPDNLRTNAQTVIHIFSNVLDMPEFEREHIAEILNQDMSRNHILVYVSTHLSPLSDYRISCFITAVIITTVTLKLLKFFHLSKFAMDIYWIKSYLQGF